MKTVSPSRKINVRKTDARKLDWGAWLKRRRLRRAGMKMVSALRNCGPLVTPRWPATMTTPEGEDTCGDPRTGSKKLAHRLRMGSAGACSDTAGLREVTPPEESHEP